MAARGSASTKKPGAKKASSKKSPGGASSSSGPRESAPGKSARSADFYDFLRTKVKSISKSIGGKYGDDIGRYALLLPDFFVLLTRLGFDDRVDSAMKRRLGLVVLYLVSPIDLFPEVLFGPVAFVDDLVLAAYSLNLLLNKVDPEIVKENWPGEGDVLESIREIARKADSILGKGLWTKVKAAVDKIFA